MEAVLSVIGLTVAGAAVVGVAARWWHVFSARDQLRDLMAEEFGKRAESLARQLRARPTDPMVNQQAFKLVMESLEKSNLKDRDKSEIRDQVRQRGPASVLRA